MPRPSPEDRTVQISVALPISMLDTLDDLERVLKHPSRSAVVREAVEGLEKKHAKKLGA